MEQTQLGMTEHCDVSANSLKLLQSWKFPQQRPLWDSAALMMKCRLQQTIRCFCRVHYTVVVKSKTPNGDSVYLYSHFAFIMKDMKLLVHLQKLVRVSTEQMHSILCLQQIKKIPEEDTFNCSAATALSGQSWWRCGTSSSLRDVRTQLYLNTILIF